MLTPRDYTMMCNGRRTIFTGIQQDLGPKEPFIFNHNLDVPSFPSSWYHALLPLKKRNDSLSLFALMIGQHGRISRLPWKI